MRHFEIEQRLLGIEPKLRGVVKRLKQLGLKTEPAFALALGLLGDPFESILELENLSDAEVLVGIETLGEFRYTENRDL